MADSDIQFSEQSKKRLMIFKKVIDAIMEEKIPLSDCGEIIVDRGIKGILSDIIPKEPDVLWGTIERISEANLEFFCEFVVEALERGGEKNRKTAKQKLGFATNQHSKRKRGLK